MGSGGQQRRLPLHAVPRAACRGSLLCCPPGERKKSVISHKRNSAMSQIQTEVISNHSLPIPTSSLLIVDDNSMNRIMLSRYVTKLGYQASVAENGRQALDKLQSKPFDLVLLDVQMPEMDGYEVLEQMK